MDMDYGPPPSGNASASATNEIDPVESSLLHSFSCMGTTDKDVLIGEFHRLVNYQLDPNICTFFLEMTNWNLQSAICAFYDYDIPKITLPVMSYLQDVTVGCGESVPPRTTFTKTWRLQNRGKCRWPPGTCLRYLSGDRLGARELTVVDTIDANNTTDVTVRMISPEKPGVYQGEWRMTTATGIFFGECIWAIVTVEEGGTLAVSQKLSSLGAGVFNETNHSDELSSNNPFMHASNNHLEEKRKDCEMEVYKITKTRCLESPPPPSLADTHITVTQQQQQQQQQEHQQQQHQQDEDMMS